MAAQTVTGSVNYDDISMSGLLNGETITINGGSVTIDADVRWNQQAAVLGNVTLSSTLGGSFLIDGTKVWEVPFSASSGNVPAQAAVGSNGVTGGTSGATGELLRVWATGSLEPVAAGGAMPATGWIKLRSKTGTFQTGETITLPGGATITASGAGKRSWVHVVGAAGSAINATRLSTVAANGDWYELGVTSGATNQTLQYPVADGCPAIWVETGVGTGVYEIWLNGGTGTSALWSTTDSRGKFFICTPGTGVITLAARTPTASANNGLLPVAGLRVRIPNILMSSATSANWALNYGSTAAQDSLYSFTSGMSGTVTLGYVSSNWYVRAENCGGINVTNSGLACGVVITNTKTAAVLSNVGIGIYTTAQVHGLSLTGQFAGATFTDVAATRFTSVPNSTCISVVNGQNITFTRMKILANCPFPLQISGTDTLTITDFAGVRSSSGLSLNGVSNVTVTNPRVSHQLSGVSVGTSFGASIDFTNSKDIYIEGFGGMFAADVVGTVSVNGLYGFTGCTGVEIRNVGTVSSPINMLFGGTIPTRNVAVLTRCADVVMRRVYVTGSTGNPAISAGSDSRNIELIDVWGETGADAALAAANMKARGLAVSSGNSLTISAASGTHWADGFTSTSVGRIIVAMNEPTTESATQLAATLNAAAGSGFTGSGAVLMKHATDEVICTMPNYCLGITGFANTAPTVTATNAANHTLQFQYDIGSGWNGTWLALTGANLSAVSVNPATGVKLKFRVTVATAASTNSLSLITVATVTNAATRQTQHPLPTTLNVAQISNVVSGSRVQVYNVTTATEVANEIVAGTTWSLEYNEGTNFTQGDVIRVRITKQSGATAYLPFLSLALAGSTGWTVLASQEADTVYNAIGVDGSTVTEFAPDYPNVQVDISDANGQTSVDRLYSWFVHTTTTESGIRNWFGGIVAEDAANFRVVTSILNLKLDNVSSTGVEFTGGHRLYRDDGTTPLVSSTTGGGSITLYADKVYVAETGTSGLTPEESARLNATALETTAQSTLNAARLAAALSA